MGEYGEAMSNLEYSRWEANLRMGGQYLYTLDRIPGGAGQRRCVQGEATSSLLATLTPLPLPPSLFACANERSGVTALYLYHKLNGHKVARR